LKYFWDEKFWSFDGVFGDLAEGGGGNGIIFLRVDLGLGAGKKEMG
jgi:hypothetical protein